jgi:hypothetical protein
VTIQLVPTSDSPFYSQTTVLEGTGYRLSFAYAPREDCWYLSLADSNGVDIYNGLKLIVGNPLLFKCKDPRRPPGEFFVRSSSTDLRPPGLEDLVANAGRCQLFYVTSDVMNLFRAGKLDEYLAQLATNTTTGTGSTYGQQ